MLLVFCTGATGAGHVLYAYAPPASTLHVTEIMYNPPDEDGRPGSAYEFIELYNAGETPIDLGNARAVEGIDYRFPADAALAGGALLVLAADAEAFAEKYGFAPFDVYGGQLANNGERITLETKTGAALISVRYDDEEPWPLTADGDGFSAVLRTPDDLSVDPDQGEQWRASAAPGGSPGTFDEETIPPIVVNEVLAHSDLPDVDAIELHNPTGRTADVSHWFITDSRTDPAQFQIPAGSRIAPGGYLYFTEDQLGFAFSELGEDAYLFSADAGGELTGYGHGFSFGPSTNGIAFGRYLTSTGQEHFPAQSRVTLGRENAGPRTGPLVISAVHYDPHDEADEYIEITNISGGAVPLYDPLNPDNRWRLDGVGGYEFPRGTVLEIQGRVLVVAREPGEFRAEHAVSPDVQVVGPYAGGLDRQSERLRLSRPETPNEDGTIPYVEMDAFTYGQDAWPTPLTGQALARVDLTGYGDDPVNWSVISPLTDERVYLPSIVNNLQSK